MDDFMQRIMSILGNRRGSELVPMSRGGVPMGMANDYLQPPRPPAVEEMPIDIMSLIRMLRPGNQHDPNAFQGVNGRFVQPPQEFPHRLNNPIIGGRG